MQQGDNSELQVVMGFLQQLISGTVPIGMACDGLNTGEDILSREHQKKRVWQK